MQLYSGFLAAKSYYENKNADIINENGIANYHTIQGLLKCSNSNVDNATIMAYLLSDYVNKGIATDIAKVKDDFFICSIW